MVRWNGKIHKMTSSFLVVIIRFCMIRLSLKIPENFMRLRFLNRSRFVQIPFVRIVKFPSCINPMYNIECITFTIPLMPTFCVSFIPVFHPIVNWWSSARVWVTASLLKSPGLFSVFWPILIMLLFGWSLLVFLFPIPPASLPILWWLYRVHRLHLASLFLSCSVVFQFFNKV